MNALSPAAPDHPITAAIHLEFIRRIAEGGDESGAETVEEFHRALFLHQHGPELERFRQDRADHAERISRLEAQLRQAEACLAGELKFVPFVDRDTPDDQPTAPWNAWDRTMFAAAALAIVALLVFGVLNISFNLLESGIITFAAHPLRAYFWAALLPVGALAVKVGWDFLPGRRLPQVYLWACLALGLAGVLAWVGAYASIYPSLSRSAVEQLGSLDLFAPDPPAARQGILAATTAGGVKVIDLILVSSQAVAEIFLSASLGIYLTQLYARHRPVRLATNPTFLQFDTERRALESELSVQRRALATATGQQERLEHQLSVFLAYARSLYRHELVARRDHAQRQRRLIEDIADELRTRLEALRQDADRVPPPETPERAGRNGNGTGHTLQPAPEGSR